MIDARVKAYMTYPNFDAWERVHNIEVAKGVTLWAAIIKIDPTFPRSCGSVRGMDAQHKWRKFPSAGLVEAAINYANTPERKKSLLEKLGLTRPKKYVYVEREDFDYLPARQYNDGVWGSVYERGWQDRKHGQQEQKVIPLSAEPKEKEEERK